MLPLSRASLCTLVLGTLVLAGVGLVHAANLAAAPKPVAEEKVTGTSTTAKKQRKSIDDPGKLPPSAEEMRQALLFATRTGNIEDLREALDWNEIKPETAAPAGEDPIAFWKRSSGDGHGREVLAALAELLSLHPAELPLGRDLENNIVYVWPYLAEAALDQLTPAQEVELLRLVGPAEAKQMREKKKWTWWRLTIGADGVWHSFKKGE
ncbi:conserved exported protein of unknown function [Hyphomicrobium sp. 1Nfss2.1]|uniref:hypothetical protein n=1 Tax=Hyphomicrobium sp. 1Nfss2.1 TaxID=3413936 RepID=UPI003C7E6E0E